MAVAAGWQRRRRWQAAVKKWCPAAALQCPNQLISGRWGFLGCLQVQRGLGGRSRAAVWLQEP